MRRSLIVALIAASLLFAGCGTSGGDDAATDDDGAAVTTTAADSSTTEAQHAPVSKADLESILPTADDIGPAYTVKEPDHEQGGTTTTTVAEDPADAALAKACPEAAKLGLMDDEVNDDEVAREFSTQDGRGIEITLDPTPTGMSDAAVDDIVEALNSCDTITYTDPDSGKVSMDLSAERLADIGEYGVDVSLKASFELFEVPVALEFHGYLFVVNGVGVTVTASSGLDQSTFETVPADTDRLEPLSIEMEQRVKTVTD
ncbi:hypothetical protein [Aquihabitans sp. McL0605]|uniref:hypothetical protein n=1 Tax=Aquihabitans sp. McL0605 TaxID=3415671 RepID=UPI003CF01CDF